ncbi:FtsX-like permease family protein [Paenibacillus gansuensis]|uniref:FtsX-like permease family protein n=1 Tax=Paenibacillus gansuensis TaxID=306542 RepID=A0ABW5PJJ2_9BACL
MNFQRLAYHNIVRNQRTYISHFLSSIFSVLIFFSYAVLLFHPDLQGELQASSDTVSILGTIGMKISEILIFVFSFFFLLYSVGAFLKLRKKEIGILLLLGMSRKQLHRLLFIENALIGFSAIAAGIGLGLVFLKLTLLLCANVLSIDQGLPFYVPTMALIVTAAAYLILFLLVGMFTSVMVQKGTLAELIMSEDRPKKEPKASFLLSTLAILLIGTGYAIVFLFVYQVYSSSIIRFLILLGGVGAVIIGTYFLFTQFSVQVIGWLKRRTVYFVRTNMLTLSELAYRVKDNAVMFFMVAVVSAGAFTGVGTTLAIGNPGLAAMVNPYAFTYSYPWKDAAFGERKSAEIGKSLEAQGFDYWSIPVTPVFAGGYGLISLSAYNRMAAELGYPLEQLSDDRHVMLSPSFVRQANEFRANIYGPTRIELDADNFKTTVKVAKVSVHLVFPDIAYNLVVVTDNLYNRVLSGYEDKPHLRVYRQYTVEHWKETRELSRQWVTAVETDNNPDDQIRSLALEWVASRQENGILLMISGLVGIVFFTFAASFIYFRLYADLDRDEQQYRMISKVGLSRKEMKTMITRQLAVLFFLPLGVALVHTGVAFLALQQLVHFSIWNHSLIIIVTAVTAQIIYFFLARWRYLSRLYRKLEI